MALTHFQPSTPGQRQLVLLDRAEFGRGLRADVADQVLRGLGPPHADRPPELIGRAAALSEGSVARALAKRYFLPYVDLRAVAIAPRP